MSPPPSDLNPLLNKLKISVVSLWTVSPPPLLLALYPLFQLSTLIFICLYTFLHLFIYYRTTALLLYCSLVIKNGAPVAFDYNPQRANILVYPVLLWQTFIRHTLSNKIFIFIVNCFFSLFFDWHFKDSIQGQPDVRENILRSLGDLYIGLAQYIRSCQGVNKYGF